MALWPHSIPFHMSNIIALIPISVVSAMCSQPVRFHAIPPVMVTQLAKRMPPGRPFNKCLHACLPAHISHGSVIHSKAPKSNGPQIHYTWASRRYRLYQRVRTRVPGREPTQPCVCVESRIRIPNAIPSGGQMKDAKWMTMLWTRGACDAYIHRH